ncbi:hypothetical protein ROHU_017675 [Labeo rohita]|uniref:Uncharacterized protein n=1 Tax=Labeo rohita TaxID=84645 RepID=A0A498NEP5_LABRO|nr:hypothetical protein ROHU_017675 [Labeo rohita]
MPVVSCGSGHSVRLTAPDQLSSFLCWVEGNAPSDQQIYKGCPTDCSSLDLDPAFVKNPDDANTCKDFG